MTALLFGIRQRFLSPQLSATETAGHHSPRLLSGGSCLLSTGLAEAPLPGDEDTQTQLGCPNVQASGKILEIQTSQYNGS